MVLCAAAGEVEKKRGRSLVVAYETQSNALFFSSTTKRQRTRCKPKRRVHRSDKHIREIENAVSNSHTLPNSKATSYFARAKDLKNSNTPLSLKLNQKTEIVNSFTLCCKAPTASVSPNNNSSTSLNNTTLSSLHRSVSLCSRESFCSGSQTITKTIVSDTEALTVNHPFNVHCSRGQRHKRLTSIRNTRVSFEKKKNSEIRHVVTQNQVDGVNNKNFFSNYSPEFDGKLVSSTSYRNLHMQQPCADKSRSQKNLLDKKEQKNSQFQGSVNIVLTKTEANTVCNTTTNVDTKRRRVGQRNAPPVLPSRRLEGSSSVNNNLMIQSPFCNNGSLLHNLRPKSLCRTNKQEKCFRKSKTNHLPLSSIIQINSKDSLVDNDTKAFRNNEEQQELSLVMINSSYSSNPASASVVITEANSCHSHVLDNHQEQESSFQKLNKPTTITLSEINDNTITQDYNKSNIKITEFYNQYPCVIMSRSIREANALVAIHDYFRFFETCASGGRVCPLARREILIFMIEIGRGVVSPVSDFSIHMAINLFDRYLSKLGESDNHSMKERACQQLEAVGAACLFICSKLEDCWVLSLGDICKTFDKGSENRRNEVLFWELEISRRLDFVLYSPTLFDFLFKLVQLVLPYIEIQNNTPSSVWEKDTKSNNISSQISLDQKEIINISTLLFNKNHYSASLNVLDDDTIVKNLGKYCLETEFNQLTETMVEEEKKKYDPLVWSKDLLKAVVGPKQLKFCSPSYFATRHIPSLTLTGNRLFAKAASIGEISLLHHISIGTPIHLLSSAALLFAMKDIKTFHYIPNPMILFLGNDIPSFRQAIYRVAAILDERNIVANQ